MWFCYYVDFDITLTPETLDLRIYKLVCGICCYKFRYRIDLENNNQLQSCKDFIVVPNVERATINVLEKLKQQKPKTDLQLFFKKTYINLYFKKLHSMLNNLAD